MTASPAPSTTACYSERLLPGPLGWALVLMLAVFSVIALFPVSPTVAVIVGAVVVVAGIAVGVITAPRVAVSGGELCAGQAHIPLALLGEVRELDADATRVELGPDLDSRAYVCLRAWARTAVRAEVLDPADATPYWLVSTRHPRDLSAAIASARDQLATRGE